VAKGKKIKFAKIPKEKTYLPLTIKQLAANIYAPMRASAYPKSG
jgi:hypothetical protein